MGRGAIYLKGRALAFVATACLLVVHLSCGRIGYDPSTKAGGTECLLNSECAFTCIGGACADVSSGGGQCDDDDDCETNLLCIGDLCSVPGTECGNSLQETGENCDDGAGEGEGLCLDNCTGLQICGNSTMEGSEFCDEGSNSTDDWSVTGHCDGTCTGTSPACGDGVVDTGFEECDDGGLNAGDGCDATCRVESGWQCVGIPSTCMPGACPDASCGLGETCAADCPTETHCADGVNNDEDLSGADCLDPDCADVPPCNAGPGRTTIYIATGPELDGNLNGRVGADDWCRLHKPATLPPDCGSIHAFLSTTSNNAIKDFPTIYGYPAGEAIYWWHTVDALFNMLASDWTEMLSCSILASQQTGTGIGGGIDFAWSGSDCNGKRNAATCGTWTRDGTMTGMTASTSATSGSWLTWTSQTTYCNGRRQMRCISRCDSIVEVCDNSVDDDGDGLADCLDDDCATDFGCVGRNLLFLSTTTFNGNLASGAASAREGADAKCAANIPANMPAQCRNNIHALLSVDAGDDVADMPTNYGYPADEPVYWWHDSSQELNRVAYNWLDMLDGSVLLGESSGAGVSTGASSRPWTGSLENGTVSADNCNNWTNSTASFSGVYGYKGSFNDDFLTGSNSTYTCDAQAYLRCVSRCQ